MRKRPFLMFLCMFLAGVLVRLGVFAALAVPLVCVLAVWEPGGRGGRWLVPLLGLVLFGAGILRTESGLRFRQTYLPDLQEGQEIRLSGEVARAEVKQQCIYYYLADCVLDRPGGYVPCNDVLVYASSDDYSIGQILVVRGTISLFHTPRNEGEFDMRSHYRCQKIDFGVWADEVEASGGIRNRPAALLARLGERLADSAAACGDRDGILAAMLLGEKDSLDAEVKSLYQKAGISHILAISGLHVSLLGVGLYRLLRRCRFSYIAASSVTAALMLAYGAMCGGSVSTKRAIGMLLVCLLADVLGRGYDMLSALGFTGILLLWDNPFLAGYSGFIFSVTAVLGVGIAAPVLTEWRAGFGVEKGEKEEEDEKAGRTAGKCADMWGNLRRRAADSFLSGLGISLATLPVVAFYYYELPSYAVFLNLLVLMLVKYVAVLGAASVVLGLVSVRLGSLFMLPCRCVLDLYAWACEESLALPFSTVTAGHPDPVRLLVYYAFFGAVLFVMHRRTLFRKRLREEDGLRREGERKRRGPAAGRVFTVGLTVLSLVLILILRPPAVAEIDILDVGQGDGIYLCTSDGVRVFLDGGSSDVSGVGNYRILPFLKYRGVGRIDYWFVSHSDADHVSGLKEVLESGYPVGNLVLAMAACGEEKTGALAELAAAAGVKVCYMEASDVLVAGNARLTCLYPAKDVVNDDVNVLSLVLRLEDLGFSALFTGDIPAEVERLLLAESAVGKVDLLKAAHHGSKYSNCYEFLQALSPSVSVISCGEGNRYGHPGEEALENMRKAGSAVCQTRESGQLRVRYGEGQYEIRTFLEGL